MQSLGFVDNNTVTLDDNSKLIESNYTIIYRDEINSPPKTYGFLMLEILRTEKVILHQITCAMGEFHRGKMVDKALDLFPQPKTFKYTEYEELEKVTKWFKRYQAMPINRETLLILHEKMLGWFFTGNTPVINDDFAL